MKRIDPKDLRVQAEFATGKPADGTGRRVDGVRPIGPHMPRPQRHRRGGWAAGFVLLFMTCFHANGAAQNVQVTDHLAARGEMRYEIQAADCRIRWTVTRAGINAGIAQQQSDCRLPMREQLPLQSQVLARMAAEEPGLRTLFWGRLGAWPEWSARLVKAAARSPDWNSRKGRPRSGRTMSAFLLPLMAHDDGVMFAELRQVLAESNLGMKVSGVEKVSVAAAGTLPIWQAQLASSGIAASVMAPHDCLIWFAVEKTRK